MKQPMTNASFHKTDCIRPKAFKTKDYVCMETQQTSSAWAENSSVRDVPVYLAPSAERFDCVVYALRTQYICKPVTVSACSSNLVEQTLSVTGLNITADFTCPRGSVLFGQHCLMKLLRQLRARESRLHLAGWKSPGAGLGRSLDGAQV